MLQVHQKEQKEKKWDILFTCKSVKRDPVQCELYEVSMQLFSDGIIFIENKSLFPCGQKDLTSTYLPGWQEILSIGILSVGAIIWEKQWVSVETFKEKFRLFSGSCEEIYNLFEERSRIVCSILDINIIPYNLQFIKW